jgi:cyclic pyranopterin monophosphate synthase
MSNLDKETLTHINKHGQACMVDISDKSVQKRTAIATGIIHLCGNTVELIKNNDLKKGDVLSTARIAGIQSAKQTSNLIPLCHQILTEKITVDFTYIDKGIKVETLVRCSGKTGVEMEALTAASVALLTIYDMCKAVDKEMIISDITLLEKTKIDL